MTTTPSSMSPSSISPSQPAEMTTGETWSLFDPGTEEATTEELTIEPTSIVSPAPTVPAGSPSTYDPMTPPPDTEEPTATDEPLASTETGEPAVTHEPSSEPTMVTSFPSTDEPSTDYEPTSIPAVPTPFPCFPVPVYEAPDHTLFTANHTGTLSQFLSTMDSVVGAKRDEIEITHTRRFFTATFEYEFRFHGGNEYAYAHNVGTGCLQTLGIDSVQSRLLKASPSDNISVADKAETVSSSSDELRVILPVTIVGLVVCIAFATVAACFLRKRWVRHQRQAMLSAVKDALAKVPKVSDAVKKRKHPFFPEAASAATHAAGPPLSPPTALDLPTSRDHSDIELICATTTPPPANEEERPPSPIEELALMVRQSQEHEDSSIYH